MSTFKIPHGQMQKKKTNISKHKKILRLEIILMFNQEQG